MRMLAVAAAAGIALLAAGSEFVRAEDGGEHVVKINAGAAGLLELRDAEDNATTAEQKLAIRKTRYQGLIVKYASQYEVPVDLALAVVQIESAFRPTVRGSAGEIGLMQIKPATARLMGYKGKSSGLFDPETNIRYGMKYLAGAHDLGDGKLCRTILKYNAGHGAKRMNPVSKRYCGKVQTVLAAMERLEPTMPASLSTVALVYGRTYPLTF